MTTFDEIQTALQKNPCEDCLILEALKVAVQEGEVSITMLHQRLQIGFSRADRLTDQLLACGVIERGEPGFPYVCRVSREELGELLHHAGKST